MVDSGALPLGPSQLAPRQRRWVTVALAREGGGVLLGLMTFDKRDELLSDPGIANRKRHSSQPPNGLEPKLRIDGLELLREQRNRIACMPEMPPRGKRPSQFAAREDQRTHLQFTLGAPPSSYSRVPFRCPFFLNSK